MPQTTTVWREQLMNLVPFAEMLGEAKKNHYAVPAFNVVNMESIQAVTQAAQLEGSPLIIQLYRDDLAFAGADYMVAMANLAAGQCTVPISVSLDHGHSFEQAVHCIESGFTGVMIDLSSSDFEENVRTTKQVVEFAHARGVSVEAELGEIFDASAPAAVRNSGMTDPAQAKEFVLRTGIDALAVSVGTAHGVYSSKPEIDFERLGALVQTLACPVVVHGGSNTPDEDLREICRLGVAKINVGTDLNLAFNQGLKTVLDEKGAGAFMRDVLGAGRHALLEAARHKIRLFRSHAGA